MYQKRSTSKKRAADADPKINMDEKEATPVEDVEARLPPIEPEKPAQRGDQPGQPTQPEGMNLVEMMRNMMEETLKNNMESLKQELSGKIDDNCKNM